MRGKIVIYAIQYNNFEYIAPHLHNTYIYYIVVNICIILMRCDIFKIIAPSCVHKFLLPHMRHFFLRFLIVCFVVRKKDLVLNKRDLFTYQSMLFYLNFNFKFNFNIRIKVIGKFLFFYIYNYILLTTY